MVYLFFNRRLPFVASHLDSGLARTKLRNERKSYADDIMFRATEQFDRSNPTLSIMAVRCDHKFLTRMCTVQSHAFEMSA